jgi:hypothetical protein
MDRSDVDEEELRDALIRSVSAQLVADRLIDPTGLSKREFEAAALAELRRLLNDGVEFNFIVDHKSSVLEQARAFAQSGQADFAIMFYAMWIEHWLNGMFIWKSASPGAPPADVHKVLRGSLKNKLKIEWAEYFGDKLASRWIDVMLDIADHRNEYVHYKWREDPSKEEVRKSTLLLNAEWVVGELDAMEHQVVYAGFPHIK